MNNFDEVMAKRSDAELLKIVNELRNDYQQEAVLSAARELKKRNLSDSEVGAARQELAREKHVNEVKANEPLSLFVKVKVFFMPVAFAFIYSAQYRADGYERKANELNRWTKYGFCFYLIIIAIILISQKIG